jgi:hypothetical protein
MREGWVVAELSDEELDWGLDGFNELEVRWGAEEAVRMMLVFHPVPERVRLLLDRANELSKAALDAGDRVTARRFMDTAESLFTLAEKAEKLPPVDWSRLK